jgi:hypothetical protein
MKLIGTLAVLACGLAQAQIVTPYLARVNYPPIQTGTAVQTCQINSDSANDAAGWVFRAPAAGAVTAVRFHISAVTSAQSLDVRLETVSPSDGYPTGALAWTSASGTLATPTAAHHEVSLTASSSVSYLDLLAIRVQFTSTAGDVTFGTGVSTAAYGGPAYRVCRADTVWSKSVHRGPWAVQIGGTWYPVDLTGGVGAYGSQNFSTTYYGNRIVAADFTLRVVGIVVQTSTIGTASGLTGAIYSGGVLVAATPEYDTDTLGFAASSGTYSLMFSSPVVLQKGRAYDYVVYRSSGSGGQYIYYTLLGSASHMSIMPYGANIYGVYYLGGWTEQPTRRYGIALLVDGFFGGSGGFVVTQ